MDHAFGGTTHQEWPRLAEQQGKWFYRSHPCQPYLTQQHHQTFSETLFAASVAPNGAVYTKEGKRHIRTITLR